MMMMMMNRPKQTSWPFLISFLQCVFVFPFFVYQLILKMFGWCPNMCSTNGCSAWEPPRPSKLHRNLESRFHLHRLRQTVACSSWGMTPPKGLETFSNINHLWLKKQNMLDWNLRNSWFYISSFRTHGSKYLRVHTTPNSHRCAWNVSRICVFFAIVPAKAWQLDKLHPAKCPLAEHVTTANKRSSVLIHVLASWTHVHSMSPCFVHICNLRPGSKTLFQCAPSRRHAHKKNRSKPQSSSSNTHIRKNAFRNLTTLTTDQRTDWTLSVLKHTHRWALRCIWTAPK